ncbi:acetamidase/formamidase [Mumia flava]|uniref:Acetamidase/formamidase n=1 Tax=Mumia flava TaxID=1348852 RepID=A0A0B2BA85_9ACTN|nr:acetamidase/formamidase family protein [Mumia flava]PJJ58237.1 acetamidase/formamidase [Mumia flava]
MIDQPTLHRGTGDVAGDVYLPADGGTTFWGRLPCAADAPVLTVDPGTAVTIDTISHEGILEDQGRDPRAFFTAHGVEPEQVLDDAIEIAASDHPHTMAVDGPHVVTGPIAVRGARRGDLLKITVLDTTRRVPYGVVSNRHNKGALPGEFPPDGVTFSAFCGVEEIDGTPYGTMPLVPGGEPAVAFGLDPFLGIMGVATAGDERLHSVPPGPHGGNIDISLTTVGSSMYIPVQADGALAYVGDPHFAMGDGEVALTALEASLRATVRLDVVAREDASEMFGELVTPLVETSEFLVPTGLDEDLDVAMRNCVRAAIGVLGARYGMHPQQALAYLSAATDFDISQVVDIVKGVHAKIRTADFTRLGARP